MLADYHTHCLPWSPDAEAPMRDMAKAALERGITHLCFTNHIENCCQSPLYPDQFPPFHDYGALYAEFQRVRDEFAGRMDVRLGCEIGSPTYLEAEGRAVYAQSVFDFAIGSIHNLRGKRDFYFYQYPDDFSLLKPEIEEYLDENIALASSGMCDVLGHLGYMRRYMARQGKCFSLTAFRDRLEVLFRACVEHGVGIELNCSGLTDALGGFIPEPEVLKLYRRLGGELITCGTDAHAPARAGVGIACAQALLKECGFSYVCLYQAHKPEFIRL